MTILLSYLLTIHALILVLTLGIVFSAFDCDSFAVSTIIIASVIGYCLYDISIKNCIIVFVGYIFTGIIWSLWRYKRFSDHQVELINASTNEFDRSLMVKNMRISKMHSKIVSWILSWPLSMIENVTGDILRLLQSLVTKTMRSIFEYITKSALKKMIVKFDKEIGIN